MKHVVFPLAIALAVSLPFPAAGQTSRVVAVADFVDESTDGDLVDAPRLSVVLQQLLAARSGDRFKTVAVEQVRTALRAAAFSPSDLISPTRAAEIAKSVGADWIVTGRWTYLVADPGLREVPPSPGTILPPALADGRASIEIRVLEAASRKILLQDSFFGDAHGPGIQRVLRMAAEAALRRAADQIARL